MKYIFVLLLTIIALGCAKPAKHDSQFQPELAKQQATKAFEEHGFHQLSGRLNGAIYNGEHDVDQQTLFCVHRNSNTKLIVKEVDTTSDESARYYIDIYNKTLLEKRAEQLGC